MPDLVCDTSVLQYLHQLEQLDVLRTLGDRVIVPPAVTEELSEGRSLGVDVPNPDTLQWIDIETPQSAPALPLVTKMGPGEREVLALVLEHPDWVAVLDDGVACRAAQRLDVSFTGTLGILLDAKQIGAIPAVAPLLDRLDDLGFHLTEKTHQMVLQRANERPNND